MELRPYQVEAEAAILNEWKDKQRTLLVLPTGTGKTVVFANVAKKRTSDGKVLILAHRDELIRQAADKLYKATGIFSEVEKGTEQSMGLTDVVVGSVQTLMTEKRLSRFPKDYFHTIIVDEAHHVMAQSYQNVLTYFDGAKVLGVTATPDRGDMQDLSGYFDSLAYEYSLRDAIKQGYLSPIRVQTMPLNIDMGSVKVSCGDFQVNDIGNALEPYLEDIADEMAKVCKDKHTVVFLPLIAISQKFRDILNAKGFRAVEVNGQSKNRDEILQEFSEGKHNVLCNSMLLTEGWDCPIVDCIVVLRPTKIRSLYCQMIGRGTRLHPGKDHLLILDFLWMTGRHNLVHPADIIAKDKKIAEKITEKLEKGDESDLFEMERDVLEERKNALEAALREAEKERKKAKFIDPLEFELSINDESLIDYVPIFGWEIAPATDKQVKVIEQYGINADGMSKGQASKLIDKLMSRKDLTTPKQIKCLTKLGFKNVKDWKKQEASAIIAELQSCGWKPWKAHIVPEFYVPKSLKEA